MKYHPLVSELFGCDSHVEIYFPPQEDLVLDNSDIARRLKQAFPEDKIEILIS